jgi:hypothetical protein
MVILLESQVVHLNLSQQRFKLVEVGSSPRRVFSSLLEELNVLSSLSLRHLHFFLRSSDNILHLQESLTINNSAISNCSQLRGDSICSREVFSSPVEFKALSERVGAMYVIPRTFLQCDVFGLFTLIV